MTDSYTNDDSREQAAKNETAWIVFAVNVAPTLSVLGKKEVKQVEFTSLWAVLLMELITLALPVSPVSCAKKGDGDNLSAVIFSLCPEACVKLTAMRPLRYGQDTD